MSYNQNGETISKGEKDHCRPKRKLFCVEMMRIRCPSLPRLIGCHSHTLSSIRLRPVQQS